MQKWLTTHQANQIIEWIFSMWVVKLEVCMNTTLDVLQTNLNADEGQNDWNIIINSYFWGTLWDSTYVEYFVKHIGAESFLDLVMGSKRLDLPAQMFSCRLHTFSIVHSLTESLCQFRVLGS